MNQEIKDSREMPQRIQRRRTKGWKMPPNTVSVTRPGKWGNPFAVAEEYKAAFDYYRKFGFPYSEAQQTARNQAIDACLAKYRSWLTDTPEGKKLAQEAKQLLRGKNLACFCPLYQPCHADILLQIANQPPQP